MYQPKLFINHIKNLEIDKVKEILSELKINGNLSKYFDCVLSQYKDDEIKYSLLYLATISGNLDMVQLLIDYGVPINDTNGHTIGDWGEITKYDDRPINAAVQYDNFKLVDLLIESGAKIQYLKISNIASIDMAEKLLAMGVYDGYDTMLTTLAQLYVCQKIDKDRYLKLLEHRQILVSKGHLEVESRLIYNLIGEGCNHEHAFGSITPIQLESLLDLCGSANISLNYSYPTTNVWMGGNVFRKLLSHAFSEELIDFLKLLIKYKLSPQNDDKLFVYMRDRRFSKFVYDENPLYVTYLQTILSILAPYYQKHTEKVC